MSKTLVYSWKVLKLAWKANGKLTFLIILASIFQSTIFPFVQVFTLAQILNLLQNNQPLSLSILAPYVTIFVIFAILNILLNSASGTLRYLFDAKFETYLDRLVIEKFSSLDPATFEKPSFQNLISQIEGTRATMSAHIDRIIGFIDAIAKTVTAAVVLLSTFPIFIPLIMVSTLPSFYYSNLSRKMLWPFFSKKRSQVLRVTEYIKNLLSQENTSKEATIFKTGDILKSKVSSEQKNFFREYNKINNPFVIKSISTNLIQLIVFFYTQYVNIISVINGVLGIGQFTLVFQQTFNLAIGSQAILEMYSSMMMRTQMLEKFYEFVNYKTSITSSVSPKEIPNLPDPPNIEFKDVYFKYPKTDRDILNNFNLIINSGEKIALVGENGAGKTTIIKLLLRFYDVDKGEILINGINIKDIDLEKWHKHIGALFQDFIKYQFTLKENIFYGNQQEMNNLDMLKEALVKSGVNSFIDDLPDGINQVVGKMFESGIDLSGGQWQKLALARAFFRDAPILILDEPTSAIDAKAEFEIFENVQKLQADKTVIIISHRFSTVRNADRILVFDDGKIIEEGNHEKLMEKKGLYEELFSLQAKGYK